MKLLANFLKHEHNVIPRSFDEALYVVHSLLTPLHAGLTTSPRCITSRCFLVTAPWL
ncbi:hypothetical protein F5148DRAFT_1240297, partial [Russula earlei]